MQLQTKGGAASHDHEEDHSVKGWGSDRQGRGTGPNVVLEPGGPLEDEGSNLDRGDPVGAGGGESECESAGDGAASR